MALIELLAGGVGGAPAGHKVIDEHVGVADVGVVDIEPILLPILFLLFGRAVGEGQGCPGHRFGRDRGRRGVGGERVV